jgi:uncharacterized protein YjeT (DUF2065 family)
MRWQEMAVAVALLLLVLEGILPFLPLLKSEWETAHLGDRA